MVKRLVVLCCILLLPTIAASASPEGNRTYGDWWVGGQVGALWTTEVDMQLRGPRLVGELNDIGTDVAVTAGAIVGYNFCMPYRPAWQRYFGVAPDFSWNQFTQGGLPVEGNQYALAFLARIQYPLMGNERFSRGRLVPFIMFGPAIVWTNSDFSNIGGTSRTSTNFGLVAEIGLEYFICPRLSIGPSFRYRHVWGPEYEFQGVNVNVDKKGGLDQFMVLGRLAWHF